MLQTSDEVDKLIKEAEQIFQETTLLIEKLSDPTVKLLILNTHKLLINRVQSLNVIAHSMNDALSEVLKILIMLRSELKTTASPDLVNRINELESVFDDDFTRITEIVELLRVLHEEEAKNLEKLR